MDELEVTLFCCSVDPTIFRSSMNIEVYRRCGIKGSCCGYATDTYMWRTRHKVKHGTSYKIFEQTIYIIKLVHRGPVCKLA